MGSAQSVEEEAVGRASWTEVEAGPGAGQLTSGLGPGRWRWPAGFWAGAHEAPRWRRPTRAGQRSQSGSGLLPIRPGRRGRAAEEGLRRGAEATTAKRR